MPRTFSLHPLVLAFAVFFGATRPAFARRGGWSQDPYWWRIEICGVAIVLVLSSLAFGANWIARQRDEAAHTRAQKFGETTDVDDCLKDL